MKAICNALCKFPSSISGIETPPLSCCSASYLLHHSQHKSFQSCESHSKKHLQSSKKIYQWHVHIFQKKKKQFVLALNWHSFHHHKDHHQVSSSYGSSLALVGTSDETEPLLTRLHDSGQTLKPPSNSISFLESSKLSVFNHSSLQMNWIRQYWKDCQPLQDRGWNIWRCKYFKNSMFHIFNVGLFLINCWTRICTSNCKQSYFETLCKHTTYNSTTAFLRCIKRSSLSPKLRRNSYSGKSLLF